jgi:hypothetical protein
MQIDSFISRPPVAQSMFASEITVVAWEDGDIIIQLPGYLQGFQHDVRCLIKASAETWSSPSKMEKFIYFNGRDGI